MKTKSLFRQIFLLILLSNLGMSYVFSISLSDPKTEKKINALLDKMTLEEKIGQLNQVMGSYGTLSDDLIGQIRKGQIGSILNEVDPATILKIQSLAVEESPNGIPILFARDVIHGFKTIFPIPLGQAASWNPELIKQCASVSATEAASVGINWAFAPMMDVCRDPRWGRIAESLGEDPYLSSILSESMIRGFQGNDLADKSTIAACAKHFAAYGAAEGGRDYSTASVPEIDLHNIYLPPFKAAVDAGVATFMTGFNELNGVPVTANEYLIRSILKDSWGFDGFVVSDWESVSQLTTHGFAANNTEAALKSFNAGVDMDMQSGSFLSELPDLLSEGMVEMSALDDAVRRILRIKFALGLFETPYSTPGNYPQPVNEGHKELAKQMAAQTCVLLKNTDNTLPLKAAKISKLAVIGPLADDPYEQLGTWIFDGDPVHSETPLQSIQAMLDGIAEVSFLKTLETTRSRDNSGFASALKAAEESDAVILFLGEESILSGEAHSRAEIDLPGAQEDLLSHVSACGKPIIVVVMAGRPIALGNVVDKCNALLFTWHAGTMAGPAIADLLFGKLSPSAKLPVTFPKTSGQIPIYYNHKNTGKPPTPEKVVLMDDIPARAKQWSVGNVAYYLDAGDKPLYPFGFGLSYTQFEYNNLQLSAESVGPDEELEVSIDVSNIGNYAAEEISQLYIRDLVSSVTRPVKELKGFQRNFLKVGETKNISFIISKADLAYYYPGRGWQTETGVFEVFVGGDSNTNLKASFEFNSN